MSGASFVCHVLLPVRPPLDECRPLRVVAVEGVFVRGQLVLIRLPIRFLAAEEATPNALAIPTIPS